MVELAHGGHIYNYTQCFLKMVLPSIFLHSSVRRVIMIALKFSNLVHTYMRCKTSPCVTLLQLVSCAIRCKTSPCVTLLQLVSCAIRCKTSPCVTLLQLVSCAIRCKTSPCVTLLQLVSCAIIYRNSLNFRPVNFSYEKIKQK